MNSGGRGKGARSQTSSSGIGAPALAARATASSPASPAPIREIMSADRADIDDRAPDRSDSFEINTAILMTSS
jgi:hypothetical protein